jgi:predicted MFS family arabinose efflux permease
MFILTILLIAFLYNSFGYYFSVVLLDVAGSFSLTVSTATLITASTTVIGLILGFVLGVLSVKFNHKSLLLSGIVLSCVGSLGSSLAFNFPVFMAFQVLLGIGDAMVAIMVLTLIGDVLPLHKKGWAIGLVVSMSFITNVIVASLGGFIAQAAGWRAFLEFVMFPFSLACLIVGFLVFPSKINQTAVAEKPAYSKAFREVFSNKSAIACMIAYAVIAVFTLTPMYAPSFYRANFASTVSAAGLYSAGVGATGIFGGLLAGRYLNLVGRKKLTITAAILAGIFDMIFTLVPNLWLSIAFWGAAAFTISMSLPAFNGLIMEQVPSYRGTMMSITHSFRALGVIAGLLLSSFILAAFSNNYQILMVLFGAAAVISALIVLALTKDPCKKQPT